MKTYNFKIIVRTDQTLFVDNEEIRKIQLAIKYNDKDTVKFNIKNVEVEFLKDDISNDEEYDYIIDC